MSIIVDADLCFGETKAPMVKSFGSAEVELFADGDITVTGFDETYHRATLEFGYPVPPELSLIDYWQSNPEIVISISLQIPNEFGSRVALDWAEHVLPIYHKGFPYDTRPEEAIAAARQYLDDPTERNDYNLRKMFIEVTKCEQDIPYEMRYDERGRYSNIAKRHAPNFAARALGRAVSSADPINDTSMYEATVQYAAIHARVAMAYSISNIANDEDPAYRAASDKEKAWQIRRFVEAVEIVGQGGKWPPMEITEDWNVHLED
jgi:hypothetical protein